MKKEIKSFLAVLLAAITFGCLFTGCKKEGDGYTEVCKVKYTHSGGSTTLSSKFYFNYILEEVTYKEYKSADKKVEKFYTQGDICIDRTVENKGYYELSSRRYSANFSDGYTVEELAMYVGQTLYYTLEGSYEYYKISYSDLVVAYVEIKNIKDDSFDVKYYNSDLKSYSKKTVKSSNYEIEYFI